MSFYCQLVVRT